MASHLSPLDRLFELGPETLTDAELVSLLLRNGGPGQTALDQARSLLGNLRGIQGLRALAQKEVVLSGLGRIKTSKLLSAVEIGRRLARKKIARRQLLRCPAKVASYVQARYALPDQEVLGALYVDTSNRLISDTELFRGTLDRAAVEPRAILRQALDLCAAGVILFHNHPSGDPTPSREDIRFTRRMVKAAGLLGVSFHDHLVVGNTGQWVSLRRWGLF